MTHLDEHTRIITERTVGCKQVVLRATARAVVDRSSGGRTNSNGNSNGGSYSNGRDRIRGRFGMGEGLKGWDGG